MWRWVCAGKIHRAVVTATDLNYMGSILIDGLLLRAANIPRFTMVQINNLANGVAWRTYALPAPDGSGAVVLNGPPARHFQVGDQIIILAEALADVAEVAGHTPPVVYVDEANRIVKTEPHPSTGTPPGQG